MPANRRRPAGRLPPENWLRRAYPSMERFVVPDRGGHFLASGEPDRLAAEIREAVRPYRGHPRDRCVRMHVAMNGTRR